MRWSDRFCRAVCLAGSVVLLAACGGPPPDTHPNQVLTKRVQIFKQLNRAMEPIGHVAQGAKPYQRAEFLVMAQDLEKLSTKPWPYFTPDGNYPPTRAKPEVWSQPDAFRLAQDSYLAEVRQLVQAASAGDLPAIRSATDRIGRSCKSCHEKFRSD